MITREGIKEALEKGRIRAEVNIGRRTAQKRGCNADLKTRYEMDEMSAVSEYLVAALTGRKWLSGGIVRDNPEDGDVEGPLQIRWTKYDNGHLLIYPDEPNNQPWILVTGRDPYSLNIRGWIFGQDAKKKEFFRRDLAEKRNREAAYWIPQEELHDMKSLPPIGNGEADMDKWVEGYGPIPTMVAIVGEAPANEELKQGKPFVGKAGKVLDRLLEGISLPREMVYITNFSKSKLDSNKFMSDEERSMWGEILRNELKEVKPEVIVALGAISTEYFTGETVMGRVNGIPHVWRGKLVVPCIHPAAVLYRPEVEKDVVKAFKVVKQAVTGEIGVDNKKTRKGGVSLYTATLLVTRLFPGSRPKVIQQNERRAERNIHIGVPKRKGERKEKGGQSEDE